MPFEIPSQVDDSSNSSSTAMDAFARRHEEQTSRMRSEPNQTAVSQPWRAQERTTNSSNDSQSGIETTPSTVRRGQTTPNAPRTASEPSAHLADRGILVVSQRQRGNPLLKLIRNVKWEFGELENGGDYLLGKYNVALFLSLRYHLLQPAYIYSRIDEIRGRYRLRVLLCLCDVEDNKKVIEELSTACVVNGLTLVLAWTSEEAARYLESFRAFEKKGAEVIQGKVEQDYFAKLIDVLTSIRSVNRTDAMTLASTFGSLFAIATASIEELAMCPGLGEKKVKNIYEAFNGSLEPRQPSQRAIGTLLQS